MPNKKAAIKHLRQTVSRTKRNSLIKAKIKDMIKKGRKAASDGSLTSQQADDLAKNLQKIVDKAVKTGIIKSNTGDRKKSRFAAQLKKATKK